MVRGHASPIVKVITDQEGTDDRQHRCHCHPRSPPGRPAAAARSMSAGESPAAGWLSFRRIIDVPLETCVAALENGRPAGPHTGLYIGRSLLRGPIQHDRHTGTYRIEVRLARGPLRPLLPMRLHIDRWWGPPARTALELIPGTRVRPAAAYFRAGHLLLDALTRRLVNLTDLNDLQREDRPAAAAAMSTPEMSNRRSAAESLLSADGRCIPAGGQR